jgi:plastocyanin
MGGVLRSNRVLLALAAGTALALAGLAVAAGSVSVALTSTGPQPETVTATLGDSVTFVNGEPGNVVVSSERAGFTSPPLASGGAYTHVLTRSGRYAFVQGGAKLYRGTLVVERAGAVTLRASSTTLRYGATVTLSGQAAPVGFPVTIQSRPAGERDWADAASATPEADGRFAAAIRPSRGGQYRAVLFGGELVSDRVSVVLQPRMLLKALTRRAKTATPIRFTVRLAPSTGATGVELVVYERRSRSWKRVASSRVGANGTATLRWAVDEGRTLLRARVSRKLVAKGFAPSMSNQIAVVGVGADPRSGRRG